MELREEHTTNSALETTANEIKPAINGQQAAAAAVARAEAAEKERAAHVTHAQAVPAEPIEEKTAKNETIAEENRKEQKKTSKKDKTKSAAPRKNVLFSDLDNRTLNIALLLVMLVSMLEIIVVVVMKIVASKVYGGTDKEIDILEISHELSEIENLQLVLTLLLIMGIVLFCVAATMLLIVKYDARVKREREALAKYYAENNARLEKERKEQEKVVPPQHNVQYNNSHHAQTQTVIHQAPAASHTAPNQHMVPHTVQQHQQQHQQYAPQYQPPQYQYAQQHSETPQKKPIYIDSNLIGSA